MDADNRKHTGALGEETAVRYLREKGFSIVCRNKRTGRGEIDIIAEDRKWIIFVEVKTRTGHYYGSPEESIGPYKVNRIRKAARVFLMKNGFTGEKPVRFDIISIVIDRNKLEKCLHPGKGMEGLAGNYRKFSRLEHIIDAF